MTVESMDCRARYATDGVQKTFPVVFRFLRAEDLGVYWAENSQIENVKYELNKDYTVVGDGSFENGGTVIFATAPPEGRLAIRREIPYTQESNYTPNGDIPAETLENDACCFTVVPQGQMILRSRQSGDTLRRLGGTKLLKKRMIDAKIPADVRGRIPVLCDETGILGVWSMGADLARIPKELPAVTVRFEKLQIRTAEENETQKYGGAEKW